MDKDDYERVRKRIYRPVYPVPPAFNKDGTLDLKSTKKYVEFLVSKKVGTILVTAGTSRFNLLTHEEIKKLNSSVVEANSGKALVIVANPQYGSTKMAVDFCIHAEKIGADGILLYYPERYYGDAEVYSFFWDIANSTKMPLLIHGVPLRRATAGDSKIANYSLQLCRKLAKINSIVGMKEEFGSEELRYKLAVHFQKHIPLIVAGSSMRKYLSCVNFGVHSYLVGIGSIKPEIEEKFFDLVETNKYNLAIKLVREVEEPFFDVAFSIGWHVSMKTAMAITNLMPSYERKPLVQATAKQRKAIKSVMQKINLI